MRNGLYDWKEKGKGERGWAAESMTLAFLYLFAPLTLIMGLASVSYTTLCTRNGKIAFVTFRVVAIVTVFRVMGIEAAFKSYV